MSVSHISVPLRRRIRERSRGLCEYCLISEKDTFFPHEPDHIIAEKHGGETASENLALACFDCYRFKGTDIASLDPKTSLRDTALSRKSCVPVDRKNLT